MDQSAIQAIQELAVSEQSNFILHLRELTDGKDVRLKYRIMMLDNLINKISVEFKDLLKKSITIAAGFYTGTMSYQE